MELYDDESALTLQSLWADDHDIDSSYKTGYTSMSMSL